MPGADQFFHILIILYNFSSVIVNSSTLITFARIFSTTVLIYLLYGVLVSSSQMPAQKSTNFSISGTVPCFSLVLLMFW